MPLLVVAVAVAIGAFGAHLVHVAKQSVPYQMGIELVQSDALVKEKLGEPIEPTWHPPDGKQSVLETGSGDANRRFVVVGPKGEAKVSVKADCQSFVWTIREVRVHVKGERDPIVLELPPEGDPKRAREEVSRKNLVDPY